MAAFAAQLLDELMGRNRDANPNDKRRDIHWSDPEVCKYFICGICPHDLFTNTRSDLGACTKIHDESIKKEYQRSPRCEKMGYEEELLKYLNTVIVEADKRIQRGQQRLLMAASAEHNIPPTPEQAEIDCKIETIKDQISKLVEEAEALGNEGMVDAACEKTAQVDQLRAERIKLQEMREKVGRPFEEVYKRRPMEVCDICGAMLFVDDAPQRLDDHIQGKQHMGYARIRAYITGYQKKKEEVVTKKGESENGGKDKVVDGKVDGPVVKDLNTDNNVDSAAVNCAANSDKREENNEGKGDADRRRREEKSSERKREDRDRRHDDHSRRKSRDQDSHRDRSRERHRSSEHSRRSDRSRSRSRRGSQHTSRSDTGGRHHSRDRSRSRSRRDGSPGRHGSRRSNHSRD